MNARRLGAAAAAALIALGPALPAAAIGLPRVPGGGGYSVSGKGGPYVKQISGRQFNQTGGAGGSLGLADAINRGEFQAGRLVMPQTEAKVKAMLDAIEAHWPYNKDIPLKVIIVGQDYYSAYSLPDGSVVVGFGLLDQAQSDDEVAFILAHELGHVRLGHFAQQSARQAREQGNSSMAQAFMLGSAAFSGATALRGGGSLSAGVDAATQSAARRAGASSDLLRFVNNVMTPPSMSRAQEDEADALGFDLTNLYPYSAESASARVFDTIQKDEDNRKAVSDALESQLNEEVTRAVGSAGAATLVSGFASGGGLSGSNRMGLLKGAGRVAMGVAAKSQSGEGPKHRTPEERKKGIGDYSAAAYPAGLPLRDEEHRWLDGVRASKEYADAKITVRAVRSAMKLRADGQYPQAEAELAKIDATQFRSAALVLDEKARLADDKGDQAGSDRLFTTAHRAPDQSIDGYLDHGRMLYRTQKHDRALAVIGEGQARFGNDDKPFLALLIAVSRQSGDTQQADKHLQRCAQIGDRGLTKDCELAAGKAANAQQPQQAQGAQPGPSPQPSMGSSLLRGLSSGALPRLGF